MTGLTLRPPRKLFSKLLCQFGRIASIVVDVDILRDYRFDAPADAVPALGGVALAILFLGAPSGLAMNSGISGTTMLWPGATSVAASIEW
jgi:hypothetical protein